MHEVGDSNQCKARKIKGIEGKKNKRHSDWTGKNTTVIFHHWQFSM